MPVMNQNQSPTPRFYLGSAGWEHPEWAGLFYPDGLPDEWRLSYYNTFYSCVYLPYPIWSARALPELATWVEDTFAQFRFLPAPNPAVTTAQDRERLGMLAPRLAGLPDGQIGGGLLWLEDFADLKLLAGQLERLAAGSGEHYLISREHDIAIMERAKVLLGVMGLGQAGPVG